MSRRIYIKPLVKTLLSGDRNEARKLERKARGCVGYLFDQLTPNQKFRSQNFNLGGGRTITAYVWRDVLGERARVEIFAVPTVGPEPSGTLLVEHGFLVWQVEQLITYPLLVYVDYNARNYLLGDGTFVPYAPGEPEGGYHVMFGQIISDKSGKSPCQFHWKKQPTLDSNYSYSSTQYVSTYPSHGIDARTFSGLLRLAVQAKIGAGKNPKELNGFGNLAGNMHGIIIDPDTQDYWIAAITINGMTAKKLSFPDDLKCLNSIVLSGDITDNQEMALAWSYVLASLIDSGDPPITLLGSEDMLAIADSGLSLGENIWRWNRRGDKALAVLHKIVSTNPLVYQYTVWRIGITWSSGIPMAAISKGENGLWSGRGVMVEYAGLGWVPLTTGVGTAELATNGIQCGWFDSNNNEVFLRHGGESTLYTAAFSEGYEDFVCGSGSADINSGYDIYSHAQQIASANGFSVTTNTSRSGNFTTESVNVFNIGELYHPGALVIALNESLADEYYNLCGGWDGYDNGFDISLYRATEKLCGAQWEYKNEYLYGGGGDIVVGVPIDPEAAVIIARSAPITTSGTLYTSDFSDGIKNALGGGFVWQASGDKHPTDTDPASTSYRKVSTRMPASRVVTSEFEYTQPGVFLGGAIIGRDGVIHEWPSEQDSDGPFSAWWQWTGLEEPVGGPYINQSYSGRALYTTAFNEFVATGGMKIFSEGVTAWQYGRWVGGI